MPIDVTSRRKTRELEESLSQTKERWKKELAEIRNNILEIEKQQEEIKKQQEEIKKELENRMNNNWKRTVLLRNS